MRQFDFACGRQARFSCHRWRLAYNALGCLIKLMQFAVLNEEAQGETRVALVPDSIKLLLQKKHAVLIQRGAGDAASIPDSQFAAAGAHMVADAAELLGMADCLLQIRPVSSGDAKAVPEG